MAWQQSKCGGLRWQTLSDGRVEVEGQGIPTFAPTSSHFRYLARTWANWTPAFLTAAHKWKVRPSWLAAIATQETGLWSDNPSRQASIESADGFSSIGIMQPIPGTAAALGYKAEDRYDPTKNIDMGAKLVSQSAAKYGGELPLIAAAYNAGSPRCSPGRNPWNLVVSGDYISNVVAYNNTALQVLRIGAGMVLSTAALFAISTIVATGGLWLAVDRGWIKL